MLVVARVGFLKFNNGLAVWQAIANILINMSKELYNIDKQRVNLSPDNYNVNI